MKWERVNDYGIISGEYRIGKFNQGSTYGAWYGWQSLGYFPTAADAKAACAAHKATGAADLHTVRVQTAGDE